MNRGEIIDAYLFLRANNHSISSETLDFMKNVSLIALDALGDKDCVDCMHDGHQSMFPSACTGCGDTEYRNFKAK